MTEWTLATIRLHQYLPGPDLVCRYVDLEGAECGEGTELHAYHVASDWDLAVRIAQSIAGVVRVTSGGDTPPSTDQPVAWTHMTGPGQPLGLVLYLYPQGTIGDAPWASFLIEIGERDDDAAHTLERSLRARTEPISDPGLRTDRTLPREALAIGDVALRRFRDATRLAGANHAAALRRDPGAKDSVATLLEALYHAARAGELARVLQGVTADPFWLDVIAACESDARTLTRALIARLHP